MKKLLFFTLTACLFAMPLFGMKREGSDSENEPNKKPKTEQEIEQGQPTPSGMVRSPADVKLLYIQRLIDHSANTIYEAANSIRALTLTYQAFHRVINNPNNNQIILQLLADRFTDGDLVIAAIVLHTDAAKQWLIKNYPPELLHFVQDLIRQIEQGIPLVFNAWGVAPLISADQRFEFVQQRILALHQNPVLLRCIDNHYCCIHLIQELAGNILGYNEGIDEFRIRVTKLFDDNNLLEGNIALFQWLAKRKNAVIEAAKAGGIRFLNAILQNGGNINQKNRQGDNALMALASCPNFVMETYGIDLDNVLAMMRFLIKNNIDLNTKNLINYRTESGGSNAFMLAAQAGFIPGVQLLLEHKDKFDLFSKDAHGNTALHHAIDGLVSSVRHGGSTPQEINDYLEIIRLLLRNDINPTAKNNTCLTPFGIILSFIQEMEEDEDTPFLEGRAIAEQVKEIFDHFGIQIEAPAE